MHDEPLKNLTVLKASAGSGKTYQLALEYISLALTGDSDFRQILAITFTNKATKEMKERIISFLTDISKNLSRELIQQISQKTGLSEHEVVKRSSLILRKILHNYSHFAISTIDSFYQKILRGFTREIGLMGNFELELDYQKVLEYAIDEVIDSSQKKTEVKAWILEFVRDKLQSGSSWDVRRDLKNLASELNDEHYKLLEAENADLIPEPSRLSAYIVNLKKIKFSFETQMDKIGKKAVNLAERNLLSTTDFSFGKSGVFNYFNNIQNDNKKYTPGSRTLQGRESVENWYTKTSDKKDLIINVVESGLMDLLSAALDLYELHSKEYLSSQAILKNLYALGLFSEIKLAIEQYKYENDVFLLGDTQIFLKEIIENNDTPFIYEKTGSWYTHFLIDEFQDTSKLQWDNLKPLLSNTISEGRENLIVGDAKQSIYRWRGGDWELIEKEINNTFLKEYLKEYVLDTNWRSSRQIVEFNNSLFSVMPGIFEKAYLQNSSDEFHYLASDFNLIYRNINQKVAEKNDAKKGFIQISFSNNEETTDTWKETGLVWLRKQIEVLQDRGYRPGQTAVLTRTRKEGTEIVNYLNEISKEKNSYRYDVISNESLLIKNFTAVRLLINCLKYTTDPHSDLLRANVAVEYYREKNITENLSSLFNTSSFRREVHRLLPTTFLNDTEKFRKYGLLECFSSLIDLFELDEKEENFAYLTAMQDVIQKFVNERGNDIGNFLEWWEEEKDNQTLQSPESVDAIKVLTIHKSKGLEFDAVLLPFFGWDIDHRSNNVFLWAETKNKPFDDQKIVPVKYQKDLAESYFDSAYFNEKHLTFIDNLNICYVAFTRARCVLMVHSQLPKKSNLKSISSILYDSLTNENFHPNNGFDTGSAEYGYGTFEPGHADKATGSSIPNRFIQKKWTDKARLKKRGREFFEKDQKERKEKINYGLLVHEILAEIKSVDDVNQLLMVYQNQGLIAKDEVRTLRDQLDRIFANPVVEKWFQSDWVVKSECTILSPNKEELRPDRVWIKNDRAIIVDFKTGKEETAHSIQLKQYKNKLSEMGYKDIEAYVLYLRTNKVKQIA